MEGGWRGHGCSPGASGGGGDDGEDAQTRDCEAGNEDSLGVRPGIGWRHVEPVEQGEFVEQGAVRGGEAFEQIGVVAEGQAYPEAVAAGPGEKGPAQEPFRVAAVAQVEVAYVADGLDLGQREGVESSFKIEEGDASSFDESPRGKVAVAKVSLKAPDDHFFLGAGHWTGADCRTRVRSGAANQGRGMVSLSHDMVR